MRIVHLILTSGFAGSERHAIELANAQALEHDVTLVLRRASIQSRPDAYAKRVSSRVKLVLVGDWFARWHARKLLRMLKPDVAHAHLSAACKAMQGLKGLCLRVATLHISYKPQQHETLDALIAVAPWQLDTIPGHLRQHSVQIDNWTLPTTPADGARERLRELHGIGKDTWVFGAVGRAEHSKGFDLLVDAFKAAGLPDARLVIVGHGDEMKELSKRANGNILLPGFVENPEEWLAAFDCFVSAAREEPFGLVLLEAMEARLPIFASATQGARHLAGAIGSILFPVADLDALVAGLRRLANERPVRRDYPMERFRIENKLMEVETFYRNEIEKIKSQERD